MLVRPLPDLTRVREPIAQQARGLHARLGACSSLLASTALSPDTYATPGMVVHYKFKSAAQEHQSTSPAEHYLSDLKALIVADAGLRQDRRNLFDLELSHAQSGALWRAEAIARNTVVLGRLVPSHHPGPSRCPRLSRRFVSIELELSSLAIMEKENLEKQKAAAAEQLPHPPRLDPATTSLCVAGLPKWLVGRVIGRGGRLSGRCRALPAPHPNRPSCPKDAVQDRYPGPPEQVARGVDGERRDGGRAAVAARAVPPPSGGGGYAHLLCPLTGQQRRCRSHELLWVVLF